VRVGIWARVSKEEQLRGYSIEAQIAGGERLIAERVEDGWTLAGIYKAEGVSAYREGRLMPDFQRMEADIAAGRIDLVYVDKLDRLSRRTMRSLQVVGDWQRRGVQFYSRRERFDLSTAHGRKVFRDRASDAEYYSDNLGEEVRKGLYAKAVQGRWVGVPPFGADRDADGVLHWNGDADALRLAASLYRTGNWTWNDVADDLNRRGYRALNTYRQRVPFSGKALGAMFTCVAYVGQVAYKTETFPGLHPPLFDADTWGEIQRIRAQRSTWKGVKVQRDDALFAGHVWCATCGSKAHVNSASVTCSRYRCYRSRQCGEAYVRDDHAQAMLWRFLEQLRVPEEVLDEALMIAQGLVAHRSRPAPTIDLDALDARFDRAKRLYLAGDLSDAEYAAERRAIEQLRAAARPPSLLALDRERANALLGNVPQLVAGGSFAARRQFVRSMFDRVWVGDRQIVAVTPRAEVYPLIAAIGGMHRYTSVSLPPAMRSSAWSGSIGANTESV
jgi:site-specific DNA recombinase